ncbi:glycosyltransferase family 2 protein [Pseudomonas sp. gcc21]|uniref:glycosyltransferase family 2 protein n=1 Tax=Pseudomonas sp. gcc21 TaxID=2726989 RepID=UPI00145249AA|nr:glycosyltransferase family A protein [Pseudomonas sp. gcc21]QJD58660.1 glycosyltransferase family 2 protein [Pseudomonas sp. gcc21]
MKPRFSLVIATLGRVEQLRALFKSIVRQSYSNFEIILVDQNQRGMLDKLVSEFSSLNIHHHVVAFRGAARARNYGLEHSLGEFIFFPDDDCEFVNDILQDVDEYFKANPSVSVCAGRCIERDGSDSVIQFSGSASYLTLDDHAGKFVEATMFFRRDAITRVLFDEQLGVGTFHGAEEGRDVVIRMLKEGFSIYYDPRFKVYHPNKIRDYSNLDELRRVFTYRCGFSRLCVKHRLHRELGKRLLMVTCYIPYAAVVDRRKARYYSAELLGLLAGVVIP